MPGLRVLVSRVSALRLPARQIPAVAFCLAFLHFVFIAAAGTPTHAQVQQATAPADNQSGKSHASSSKKDAPPITEDQLKQQLVGKSFYLRNGYFDNSLRFNDLGQFQGSAPRASYTLSLIKIDKVHLGKRWVVIEGARYGLHFQDEGPTEDAIASADKVRITPKKKVVTILIDRARVEEPKKQKTSKHSKKQNDASAIAPNTAAAAPASVPTPAAPTSTSANAGLTQARANQQLRNAIDAVFSPGLDERMIASMPDYWRLYFQAAQNKAEYHPTDPAVLRQSAVDRKARLLSTFEPPSNDFAQAANVAGLAVYHVVIAPDGRPTEIAVARPIGFGLDENAVDSIRKATFAPATKDGNPVPVLLDVMVQFRIYSDRTKPPIATETSAPSATSPLPGPYSAKPVTTEPAKQP